MTGLVCTGRTIVTRLPGDVNLAKGTAIRYSNLASNEPLRVSAIPTVVACAPQHKMAFLPLWIATIHRGGQTPMASRQPVEKHRVSVENPVGIAIKTKKIIKFWGQFKLFYRFIKPGSCP